MGYARKIGDFSFNVSGWATTWRTLNTKVANDVYQYEWQKLTGADESAYRGYVCIGKFETFDQIENLPKLSDNDTQIGDLMYAQMTQDWSGLSSGNDAANAAAVRVGGSIEGFAVLMNKKAEELGLENYAFIFERTLLWQKF